MGKGVKQKPLNNTSTELPSWLNDWMTAHEILLWDAADLRQFATPQDETGKSFSHAVAFAIPLNPEIMLSIQNGPNQPYADEYASVNNRINALSIALSSELKDRGHRSNPLADGLPGWALSRSSHHGQ